jgi:dCMP deaminase
MRPTLDEYYMDILVGVAARATCPRRQTSALLVDEHGRLLASGYNGVPVGIPHCTETPCPGVNDASGDTSRCVAVHAEINAITQAGDRLERARTLYTLTEPCFRCAVVICNTGVERVVYRDAYPDQRCVDLFEQRGIHLIRREAAAA